MKNAIESSVFFSIATQTDLKENHNVTVEVIDAVTDYFKKVTNQEFMLCYVDKKGFRKNNFNDKYYQNLIERIQNNEVFSFISISKRMTTKEFYGPTEGLYEPKPEFCCSMEIGNPNSLRFAGNTCDVIKLGVPATFLTEKSRQKSLLGLMKKLQKTMNGFCSFITIGTFDSQYAGCCAVFDYHFYETYSFFSIHWDEYVRGYFWGQCLTPAQANKLGGFEAIQKQGFAVCEKWGDGVYIQSTERILDYTMEDALTMREYLKPLFPPESKRRVLYYTTKEKHFAAMPNSVYFYADEDMFATEEILGKQQKILSGEISE